MELFVSARVPMFVFVLQFVSFSHTSGYLSNIFNGQCTMSRLLAQSSFGPGLPPRSCLQPEQVQTLIPQLRPCNEEFCTRLRLSLFFLYNLGEPIWKNPLQLGLSIPVLRSSIRASSLAIPPTAFFPTRAK